MSEYKWIKSCGLMREEELIAEVLQKLSENQLFLAYNTDSFQTGHADEKELSALKPENLLELRIFSEEQELCCSRSRIGEEFQWRIASEKDVPPNGYIVQYQTLDINRDRMKKEENAADQNGNCILYTTVGGKYTLPIRGDEDSSKVICYVAYDENGMAKMADYRLCGFVQKNPAEKAERGDETV